MKNFKIVLVCLFIVLNWQCSLLKKTGLIPNEFEMASGLKSALKNGLLSGFDKFSDPNNMMSKLTMPGEIEKLNLILNSFGVKTNLTNISNKLTNALSKSMAVSKPVFLDALQKMSIRDAAKILVTDNPHAATDYFKATATKELIAQITPIIDSSIKTDSINAEYNQIASLYNAIPFSNKKIEPTASGFIAGRTIDLMFMYISKEETEIRTKYQLRKTDLLRKVFDYAEQEVKKKYNNYLPQ